MAGFSIDDLIRTFFACNEDRISDGFRVGPSQPIEMFEK